MWCGRLLLLSCFFYRCICPHIWYGSSEFLADFSTCACVKRWIDGRVCVVYIYKVGGIRSTQLVDFKGKVIKISLSTLGLGRLVSFSVSSSIRFLLYTSQNWAELWQMQQSRRRFFFDTPANSPRRRRNVGNTTNGVRHDRPIKNSFYNTRTGFFFFVLSILSKLFYHPENRIKRRFHTIYKNP